MSEREKFYRYESVRYSITIDAEMEIFGTSSARLHLTEYYMVAETPKGYWIGFLPKDKWKWISKTSRKRFAHPTKEEALNAYRLRKMSYVRHSKERLKRAEEDLRLVENVSEVIK